MHLPNDKRCLCYYYYAGILPDLRGGTDDESCNVSSCVVVLLLMRIDVADDEHMREKD